MKIPYLKNFAIEHHAHRQLLWTTS